MVIVADSLMADKESVTWKSSLAIKVIEESTRLQKRWLLATPNFGKRQKAMAHKRNVLFFRFKNLFIVF